MPAVVLLMVLAHRLTVFMLTQLEAQLLKLDLFIIILVLMKLFIQLAWAIQQDLAQAVQ